jgi:outer membrane lipoprotein LolB
MLSGCATRPSDVSQSQRSAQIAQQQLNQLQQWSVSGKLAIITPTERKSAYLSWQQQNDSVTMTLTTIVGTTIAKLHYDGNIATLTADDQTWQDSSPSALIYRVTGWDVPVESLSHWMKGQVKRDVVSEYFDNGLVKQIRAECSSCLPWQINYSTYGEFILNEHLFTLPTAMRLTQALTQTRLILRIDSWKAEDV